MNHKREIREMMLKKRRSLERAERDRASRVITEKLAAVPEYSAASTVMTYISMDDEVQTLAEIERLLGEARVLVPKILDGAIAALEFHSLDDLLPGQLSVLEPKTEKKVQKEEIDVVVVPGLAFDSRGYRVGFGKGHYDRFLKDFGGKTIGIGFSFQLIDRVPADDWDVPLDMILTED